MNRDNASDMSDDDSDAGLPIATGVVIQDRQIRVVADAAQLSGGAHDPQGLRVANTSMADFVCLDLDQDDPLFQQDKKDDRNVSEESEQGMGQKEDRTVGESQKSVWLATQQSATDVKDHAALKAIENQWLIKTDIDCRMLKVEERDLLDSIDMHIGIMESKKYTDELDHFIRENEMYDTELADARASQRVVWSNPEVWHDAETSLTIRDYTGLEVDTSSWELTLQPDISIAPLGCSYASVGGRPCIPPFHLEVAKHSLKARRIYGRTNSLTREHFQRDFVDKFNKNSALNMKCSISRLKNDCLNWRIDVYEEDRDRVRVFEAQLRRWESRKIHGNLPEDDFEMVLDEDGILDCDEENLGSGQIPPTSARKSSRDSSYDHFHAKYKAVVITEFKSEGIKYNTAISSMWKRHKLVFGERCNDECKCVFSLPDLTSTVIYDYLGKLKKTKAVPEASNLKSRELAVGFAGNFAKRFLPLLGKEYLSESPLQILNRLTKMWEIHRANICWSTTCKDNCDCLQGWEDAFCCGDCLSGTSKSTRPRQPSVFETIQVAKSGDPTAGIAIPKKRKATSPATMQATPVSNALQSHLVPKKPRVGVSVAHSSVAQDPSQQVATECAEARSNSDSRRRASGNRSLVEFVYKSPPQSSTRRSGRHDSNLHPLDSAGRREYDVDLSTDAPLGYYFVDKWSHSGKRNCTIHSICPGNSSEHDPRIRPGTIVVAVTFEGQRKEVSETKDLKQVYEVARSKESNLKLWLVNKDSFTRDPASQSLRHNETYSKDWCDNGYWRGAVHNGWAGGAKELIRKSSCTQKSQSKSAERKESTANTAVGRNCGTTVERWEKIDLSLRRLRSVVGKSILRPTVSRDPVPRGKKSARFDDKSPAEWRFGVDTPTTEFYVNLVSQDFHHRKTDVTLHEREAAEKKRFQEVATELRTIFQRDLESIVDFFNREGTGRFTETMFQETRRNMRKEGSENIFRHNLLKLFIHVACLGPEARHLHEWTQVELTIDRVAFDGNRKNVLDMGDVFLLVRGTRPESKDPEDFDALRIPFKELSGSVTTNAFAFNPSLTSERAFEFQLRKRGETIGTANIMLNMIYPSCKNGGDKHFSVPVQGAYPVGGAQIHFRARRLFAPGLNYLEQEKRKKFKEKMQNDIIEDLLKKNITRSGATSSTLLPDAVRADGLTLLQIAVHFELAGVVQNLLPLKADPRPGLESLESLFRTLERDEQSPLNDGLSQHILAERRKRLERIAEILRTAVSHSNVNGESDNDKHTVTSQCLPALQSDWLHHDVPKTHKCKFVEGGQECARGRGGRCTFVHVQPAWGSRFDEYYETIPKQDREPGRLFNVNDFLDNMKEESRACPNGTYWCTAGYRKVHGSRELGQRVIYAEASRAERNESGVCWFPSREKAIEALLQTVTLSIWAERNSFRLECYDRRASASPKHATGSSVEPVGGNLRRGQEPPLPPHPRDSPPAAKQAETEVSHNESPTSRTLQAGFHDSNGCQVSRHSDVVTPTKQADRTVGQGRRASRYVDVDKRWTLSNGSRSSPDAGHTHGSQVLHVHVEALNLRDIMKEIDPSVRPPCKYFNRAGGCKKGATCTWAHIEQSLNNRLIPNIRDRLEHGQIVWRSGRDSAGTAWYTAGYYCKATGIYYFPEQNGGKRFGKGVWWYTSWAEAGHALCNAVASSRHLRRL